MSLLGWIQLNKEGYVDIEVSELLRKLDKMTTLERVRYITFVRIKTQYDLLQSRVFAAENATIIRDEQNFRFVIFSQGEQIAEVKDADLFTMEEVIKKETMEEFGNET